MYIREKVVDLLEKTSSPSYLETLKTDRYIWNPFTGQVMQLAVGNFAQ